MPKTTKKNRKKNLSAKPLMQYVTNTTGSRFVLKSGKLFRVYNYSGGYNVTQSVRLRDLRETFSTGSTQVPGVQVERVGKDVDKYGNNWSVVRDGSGATLSLSIGCQTFEGRNAEKILKRARVTV